MRVALLAAVMAAGVGGSAVAEPYANVFAGMMVLDSTVTVGGVKLVDQGGDVGTVGARVGYGWTDRQLYLGAEAEGYAASGRSRAMVNGVGYAWQPRGGIGAYGRIGWLYGTAMVFARAGVQGVAVNGGWEVRPVVGGGAEVPLSGRWSARIDGDYSWSSGPEIYRITFGVTRRF